MFGYKRTIRSQSDVIYSANDSVHRRSDRIRDRSSLVRTPYHHFRVDGCLCSRDVSYNVNRPSHLLERGRWRPQNVSVQTVLGTPIRE